MDLRRVASVCRKPIELGGGQMVVDAPSRAGIRRRRAGHARSSTSPHFGTHRPAGTEIPHLGYAPSVQLHITCNYCQALADRGSRPWAASLTARRRACRRQSRS
ncbi:hypothetical protein FMEAI12_3460011 [Parafrankia sp. Ea1.12]|nr:hypothetical protein FMEAI12_3460011 [Parafrankia sp. Ea1.12]